MRSDNGSFRQIVYCHHIVLVEDCFNPYTSIIYHMELIVTKLLEFDVFNLSIVLKVRMERRNLLPLLQVMWLHHENNLYEDVIRQVFKVFYLF